MQLILLVIYKLKMKIFEFDATKIMFEILYAYHEHPDELLEFL